MSQKKHILTNNYIEARSVLPLRHKDAKKCFLINDLGIMKSFVGILRSQESLLL